MGLGIAANMVPGNYSAAFCAQLLSTHAEKLPRIFWNTMATIVFVVISIPGRDKLLTIFSNFLPLIGYWTIMWIVMTAEEEWLFRRRIRTATHDPAKPYDWNSWSDRKKLPLGLAATAAFLIGWAGAILCMNQVYYTGPIARMAGGADIGLPVGAAWAGLVYPPLRYMEWKKTGR
jgi:purine-cytosine permease-like protein